MINEFLNFLFLIINSNFRLVYAKQRITRVSKITERERETERELGFLIFSGGRK